MNFAVSVPTSILNQLTPDWTSRAQIPKQIIFNTIQNSLAHVVVKAPNSLMSRLF